MRSANFWTLASMKIPNNVQEDLENNREEIIEEGDEGYEGLDHRKRYLQIAFNRDLYEVRSVLNEIPESDRIIIEAGTPFIKKEGMRGVRELASLWGGYVVADMKIADGAAGEVEMASGAGASAVTAIGSAPIETLDKFIEKCEEHGVDSMIDMIGVSDTLAVLRKLKKAPKVVILHKGRDEESNKGKIIPYKEVNRIKSKFDALISAAGGVDLKEARSAIFNGANIVVVNIVNSNDGWKGIDSGDDIEDIARKFLETIE